MKWEYLILCVGGINHPYKLDETDIVYNLNGENMVVPLPHGKVSSEYYGEFMPKLMNQLGEQGWELCAGEGRPYLFFKRPKS